MKVGISATDKILETSSDRNKTLRMVAYFLRIKSGLKSNMWRKSAFTIPELKEAENVIYKYVQEKEFHDTIINVQNKRNLPKKNILNKFTPFIDQNDKLLRVRGRNKNINVPYQSKHPIILPNKTYITELIVRNTHRILGHMGR